MASVHFIHCLAQLLPVELLRSTTEIRGRVKLPSLLAQYRFDFMQVQFLGQEVPLEKEMAPTPEVLPGKSHEQRVLVG